MEKDELHESLHLLARTSVIILIGLILSKLFSYAYRIIVARQFGPEAFGLFSLGIMITGWFMMASGLGLSDGLLRFVSIYRGENKKKEIRFVFKRVLIIQLVTSIIAAVVMYLLAPQISSYIFHDLDLIIYIRILSLSVPLSVLLGPLLSAILAFERADINSFVVNVLQNGVKVVLVLVLIALGFGAASTLNVSYVLTFLIMLVFAFFFCRTKLKDLFGKPDISGEKKKSIMKELFHYSWPFIFLGVVTSIFYWIDSLVIGIDKSPLEVGIYNGGAIPIALLFGLTSELFMRLFLPMVGKEYSRKNFSLIKGISKQVGKWIFIINLPLLVICLIFPGAIINLFFGEQFLGASHAVTFLAIGMFSYSIALISMNIISMTGKSKQVLFSFIAASILNLVLNIILVPIYGITGAAIGTMCAYLLLTALFFIETKRNLGIIPLKKEMIATTIITIVLSICLVIVRNSLRTNSVYLFIGLVILYGLAYFAALLVFGCLDDNDKKILLQILSKIRSYGIKKN